MRFRYDALRKFAAEDLERGEDVTTVEAWTAMMAIAKCMDQIRLANVPRHSVRVDGLRIAIEGDEIVNITRHNDAQVYAEPTLEILE